jgi:hypothetical protein
VYREGNSDTIRKQLICWALAVEVRPQFQLLLKIEHRCRNGGPAASNRFRRTEKLPGLKGKQETERSNSNPRGLEEMAVDAEFPDL